VLRFLIKLKPNPVLFVQTDLLNKISHPSTIVCPLTTSLNLDSEILGVHLEKGTANLHQPCDIMIDQLRAIDNERLTKKIGVLPDEFIELVKENF
jgi:mRNA interferase MazF